MSRHGRAEAAGLGASLGRLGVLGATSGGVVLAVLAQAAPLGLVPHAWPMPDLVYCVMAYVALVRPDALPVPAVFALALLRDMVLGGPVGAEALALALTIEALKRRARQADRPARLGDLMAMAIGAGAVLLAPWLLMALSLAGGPPLADLPPRWAATVAAFLPVGAALRFALRIRRRTGDDDRPGWGR